MIVSKRFIMVIKLTSDDLGKALACEIKTDSKIEFGISTDTRTIKNGDIYLPLKGENFDGESFISQAMEKGAAGAFYTKGEYNNLTNGGIFIKVNDTLETYLKLANYVRHKYNPTVVAVTGSSGKTTTKEMIYSAYLVGFPVDLIHAMSTALFLWLLAEPMAEKLERIKTKYGLLEED